MRERTASVNPTPKSKYPSTWLGEFSVLLHRNMVDVMRDVATLGATLGQGIIITIIMGFIFFRLGYTQSSIQDRLGFLFFICVNQTFG
jgi:hypothetical protein